MHDDRCGDVLNAERKEIVGWIERPKDMVYVGFLIVKAFRRPTIACAQHVCHDWQRNLSPPVDEIIGNGMDECIAGPAVRGKQVEPAVLGAHDKGIAQRLTACGSPQDRLAAIQGAPR